MRSRLMVQYAKQLERMEKEKLVPIDSESDNGTDTDSDASLDME